MGVADRGERIERGGADVIGRVGRAGDLAQRLAQALDLPEPGETDRGEADGRVGLRCDDPTQTGGVALGRSLRVRAASASASSALRRAGAGKPFGSTARSNR